MEDLTEIRWHGRGGQGVVTAAKLVAESALEQGKYFQAMPEYGAERMGAPIQAFTRISSLPVTVHSAIEKPDIVVVLDDTLLGTVDVTGGLKENGVVLVNTPKSAKEIKETLNLNSGKVLTVDATQIALESIGKPIPNTPMLGALIKATGLIDLNVVIEHLRKSFGKKFSQEIVEGNIAGLKRAYKEVKGV